uniref:Uncharacterized protein n=2 Tax=Pelagomonas calceolata TaxID=35677 RepID=A0A7S3ZSY4_9STRA
MEAAADRAWEMRKKFDLRPGVIVNVTTPETAEKGVWVGEGGAGKADCYSSYCTGEAKHTRNHLKSLQSKGLGGMVYTDLIASLQREGGTDEKSARFGNFVKECGASEIFCADDVDAEDVSLALCDDGAAGDDGVVQLVLPVWCSAAGMEVTMRLTTCRGLADTVEEPDAEYCERMCAAVDDMIGGRGSLADRYRRTGLIYNEKDPSSNGELSWILAASYSSKKDMGAYVIALNRARNGSRALVEQTNAALEEVAAVQGTNLEALRADARKREIVVKEVRRVGFGNVPKQAGFGKDLKRGFKRFLGDVTKRLRLTGCMGSANTTAHHPQIFTGTAGTAPMPPAGPPPGYALPPAPAAAPAPAAPQTPGPGGPRRFSTPMGQDAVDNQRGPPRNAPPSAQRSAFQTP